MPDAALTPVVPTALFADWIRREDGGWESMESVVTPPAPGNGRSLLPEARRHYEQALSLGTGAAARLGLAALALERGETEEAARQLAAARGLDPSLPAAVLTDVAARVGPR